MKKFNTNARIHRPVNIIVAVDREGGFGKKGKIPWNFPKDLKHFKKITDGSACIMGRRTYEDMSRMVKNRKKGKKELVVTELLPGRESYVVSKTLKEAQGAKLVRSLTEAIDDTKRHSIFVLGGVRMFYEALPITEKLFMTIIDDRYGCDRFFPISYINTHFKIVNGTKDGLLHFMEYKRIH